MPVNEYISLNLNIHSINQFKIEPIRFEDKETIRCWRNDQMLHLRQKEKITIKKQTEYFEQVIRKLFLVEEPSQILFSFFENDSFIGYGGLVHIDWISRNAEVSFLTKTKLKNEIERKYWVNFLKLISIVAFKELKFNKIYCYAYDLRPHLYPYLIESDFTFEARLKNHYYYENELYDVVIHSKFNF